MAQASHNDSFVRHLFVLLDASPYPVENTDRTLAQDQRQEVEELRDGLKNFCPETGGEMEGATIQ
jgi:hypothetical protein